MSVAVEKAPRPVMPVVTIREEGVFTSSRDVAVYFEKRHDNVVRAIDELVAQGCLLNFEGTSKQVDMPNGGARAERCYDMDRDGFMLLAMGFTGPKALQWKLRYIEAFKMMEAELTRMHALDGAYGDRRDYPCTDGGLLWGQPISKVNASANMISVVLRAFGPEAARELYRREATMPVLDGFSAGEVLERHDLDGIGCLRHLLRLSAGNGQTLGELVDLARNDSVANNRLRRHGVDAQPAKGRAYFAVAVRHSFLTEGFAESAWVGEWHTALVNLPGATLDRTRRRFGTEMSMAIAVPYSALISAAMPERR
ncbi:MAG: Rha family transcriptional regulator [Aurantimonas endophytica]|uniref:Rha family transcriptional regulator n=1 Tax=Aurantimonas endophytica TaxID=1522175 RepID=UPI003002E2A3